MEALHIGSDTFLLLIIGVLGWFARGKMSEYDDHLRSCNEIPKKTIVDRLDTLCDQIDTLGGTIVKVSEEQVKAAVQIAILVGRQTERDTH